MDARSLKSKAKHSVLSVQSRRTQKKAELHLSFHPFIPTDLNAACSDHADETCEGGFLADVLANTILALCERIQNEKDPDNVLVLMNAVKAGTESLKILCQL